MKELLFSITKNDFDIEYFKRASGAGGQHLNKTSNCCRIKHKASGAVAEASDSRSQIKNKEEAFLKCVNSPTFQKWLRREIARKQGIAYDVDKDLTPKNIKVEVRENGIWQERGFDDLENV